MKKEKAIVVIGIMLLLSLVPINKADVLLNQDIQQNNFTTYEYPSENELIITFHLPELLQQQVATELGEFTTITIPNAGFVGTIGAPQLPAVTQFYAIPTFQLSFQILDVHLMETRHIDRIYPMQSPHPDCDCGEDPVFSYDESAYQTDITIPEHLVELSETGKLRDVPFIKIKFYPIHYNAYQKTAFIYDTITIKLTFASQGPLAVESKYTEKPFYGLYKNVFDNWAGFIEHTVIQQSTSTLATGCDYLLITHPNYYTQAKQLADWKHATGLMAKTVNVSEIGTTFTQIQQYIKNAYDTWTPRPSYVLLFGDAEFIPTTYVYSTYTDLWYATVDGTDYYPDLFIGRIPADTTAQADIMIQKILTYEQSPPTVSSFYNDFVVAAYFQDDNNDHYEDRRFVRTSEEVRDYLNSIGYNGQRIYCTSPSIYPTNYNNGYYGQGEPLPAELLRPTFAWDGDANDIITAINQGIFILNHRDHGMESGWGDPYFTTSHVYTLTNGDLLPIVFSLNCLTGKFTPGECFAEEFIRKPNGGAVAVFAASAVSYSGYNDYLCRGLYDAIWPDFDTGVGTDESLYHLGAILNYGKTYMANTWGDPWGYERLTFELFHVFGDPALDIYTALPATLEVTYTYSSDLLEVTVQGNGVPIQGARVCVSQDSGYYESALTDATGQIEFDITEASTEDPVSLVTTAHNYLYYSESFMLNQKPQKPNRPDGSTEGKPNVEYMYKTATTDFDGDQLYFNFSWGDGSYSGWIGPYESDEEAFARHAWAEKGTYNITVKAKDSKDAESEWSDPLPVTMPMKIIYSHPVLQWFYERILNRYPFVGFLLGRLLETIS